MALGGDGEPLPGRGLAECDPISRDFLDKAASWHGESQIARRADEPLAFRVSMSPVQLFSMRFV